MKGRLLLIEPLPAGGHAALLMVDGRVEDLLFDLTALTTLPPGAICRAVVDRLVKVTAHIWSAGDPKLSLANATVYLETAGHIVIAWIWLEQALAAQGETGDFYDGKRQAAQFFFAYELPKVGPQLDLLAALDRTTLDMQAGWF